MLWAPSTRSFSSSSSRATQTGTTLQRLPQSLALAACIALVGAALVVLVPAAAAAAADVDAHGNVYNNKHESLPDASHHLVQGNMSSLIVKIKFIQASVVDANSTSSLLVDGAVAVSGIGFGESSDYVEISSGQHTMELSAGPYVVVDFDPTFTYAVIEAQDTQGNITIQVVALPAIPDSSVRTLDTALVRVINTAIFPVTVTLSFVSDNCHRCLDQVIASFNQSDVSSFNADAKHGITFSVTDAVGLEQVAGVSYNFGDRGVYTMLITTSSMQSKETIVFIFEDVEPYNVDLPIAAMFGILIGASVIYVVLKQTSIYLQKSRAQRATDRLQKGRLINQDYTAGYGSTASSNGYIAIPNSAAAENGADSIASPSTVGSRVIQSTICASCGRELLEADRFCGLCGTRRDKASAPPAEERVRVRSLDTFRGIALSIMLFVNYGGGGYWFFDHSTWNGLTVADLVFPWFIFMMGVSMSLSFEKLRRRGAPRGALFLKVIRRSMTLFALGLFLVCRQIIFATWRMPGVLQRFAVSYLFVAAIVMFVPIFATLPGPFRDLTSHWLQWVVIGIFITIHTCITFLYDVPGCGTGYIGPGGIGDFGQYMNCTGGAAGYIDSQVFGRHIYQAPTAQAYYLTGAYDPEGLLGCLTSVVITFLGYQAGRILVTFSTHSARLRRWAAWGVGLGLLGLILCKGTQNDGWIPINKNLWSLSFVLIMAGLGYLMLASCYIIVDVRKLWDGAPFIYPGMNSIFVYMGSELFFYYFPFTYANEVENTHGALLFMHLTATALWILIAYLMYRKKVFISV
ncbi:hgsnat protein [Capsaspora owczarzaki ATCC 30864]|uniref:Hgsnat protein n=1 Tax=Capsaspora owczarzaki (strain ATCC 30864) TaxID=595528 RepID=A0A0D2U9U6_CAPO3|nr:hgsnat protein [Capsaspora owczarzaki ATCC 30864]KJE91841.1 hgsnat protein [Capsaspora owczarzaki ATCC 30864]|eukprot:XP_004363755.1 hgsnat protein [Capsaspora owczarzaki ATCC 30864]